MLIVRCASAPGRARTACDRRACAVLGFPLGSPGEIGLIGAAAGLLGLELLAAATQPLAARAAIGQLGRQLVAARLPEALVIGGVGLGGLLEHRLDLLADRRMVRVAAGEALPAIRLPSTATSPTDTRPAFAHSTSTCVKVRPALARDGRGSARSSRDRAPGWRRSRETRCPPGSAARSAARSARRSRRRTAAARPSSPARAPRGPTRHRDSRHRTAQIDRLDRVEHEPRQMPLGSQSCRLGGNNNSCSRSHDKKFWPTRPPPSTTTTDMS